eukprot:CAMPEP_0113917176 /NCGR_PEP_ID=MMETSP0780_2-20120614/32573_1 /TAXON_ID=652834 /ORGANISM="Palpitomonas bilix" /LENGTH=555 /DNA_ID=CAMNT_0000916689 /DNA_START=63 /DNA_END=1730 /DNA_ORIENTATION=- /assembly_acc=CAM_ASM_000599
MKVSTAPSFASNLSDLKKEKKERGIVWLGLENADIETLLLGSIFLPDSEDEITRLMAALPVGVCVVGGESKEAWSAVPDEHRAAVCICPADEEGVYEVEGDRVESRELSEEEMKNMVAHFYIDATVHGRCDDGVIYSPPCGVILKNGDDSCAIDMDSERETFADVYANSGVGEKSPLSSQDEVQVRAVSMTLLSGGEDGNEENEKDGFATFVLNSEDENDKIVGASSVQVGVVAMVIASSSLPFTSVVNMISMGVSKEVERVAKSRKQGKTKAEEYFVSVPSLPFTPAKMCVELDKEDSDAEKSHRAFLHSAFGLSLDTPVFRSACSIQLQAGAKQEEGGKKKGKSYHLPNVHTQIVPSSASNMHVVRGVYRYFHYTQDQFDDRGWGCAYRSLMTLCSWFKEQHFTQKEPPSHDEIQRMLVQIGEREKKFIGSKDWIGAIEVASFLDNYLGVTSKILNVSSGADVEGHALDLVAHFDSQGTPVMIGGGVLAYTLLGVEYEETTGRSRFLILDPHYTGKHEVKAILAKGWCAWHGPELFRGDAFYNFCMPQRPSLY